MGQASLPPGFCFCPTDEEIVGYYLKRKIYGWPLQSNVIPEVDLYKCEPWNLSEKSCLYGRDSKWYFFSKYSNGLEPNRATEAGYWKVTEKDQLVLACFETVGIKKTLVFNRGRPPNGEGTDWAMHEYSLEDVKLKLEEGSYVLCQVFQKSSLAPQNEEFHGAPSRIWNSNQCSNAQLGLMSSPVMECDSLIGQPMDGSKETNMTGRFSRQAHSLSDLLALPNEDTVLQGDLVVDDDDDELHRFLLTHICDSDELEFICEDIALGQRSANENQDENVMPNGISTHLVQCLPDDTVGKVGGMSNSSSSLSDIRELPPDVLEGDFLELNDLMTPLELDAEHTYPVIPPNTMHGVLDISMLSSQNDIPDSSTFSDIWEN